MSFPQNLLFGRWHPISIWSSTSQRSHHLLSTVVAGRSPSKTQGLTISFTFLRVNLHQPYLFKLAFPGDIPISGDDLVYQSQGHWESIGRYHVGMLHKRNNRTDLTQRLVKIPSNVMLGRGKDSIFKWRGGVLRIRPAAVGISGHSWRGFGRPNWVCGNGSDLGTKKRWSKILCVFFQWKGAQTLRVHQDVFIFWKIKMNQNDYIPNSGECGRRTIIPRSIVIMRYRLY